MRPLHQLGVPDHLRYLLHLPPLHLHRGPHPLQLRDESGVEGAQSGEITLRITTTCDVLLLIMQHSLETKFIQSVQLFNAVAFCLKDEWDVILLCNMWSTLTFNLDLINGIGAYGQCRGHGGSEMRDYKTKFCIVTTFLS